MKKTKVLTAMALAGLLLAGSLQAEARVAVDPAALKALDRMGAHLRTLQTFSVHGDNTLDEVLESGQKIQFSGTVDLDVRSPDGLHANIQTDRKSRQIYYDGKNFTVYAPKVGYYASVPAPPTIGKMLDKIESKYGIAFPLVDLFRWGVDANAASKIKEARLLGASRIGGQITDHYAFRQKGLDWQIWIARGDAPLPLKYVITTLDEPGQPQYGVNLSWNTAAKLDVTRFTFAPGKDDHRIEILALDAKQAGKK